MRSPPITPCSILLLVPFLLLLLSLPLTSAQENTTCVDGYNATCCPCITSGPIICSDPAPIDSLSECVDYHPEGWACCVGEGDGNWGCIAANFTTEEPPPENFSGRGGVMVMMGRRGGGRESAKPVNVWAIEEEGADLEDQSTASPKNRSRRYTATNSIKYKREAAMHRKESTEMENSCIMHPLPRCTSWCHQATPMDRGRENEDLL
ncbi:hypothetical protein BU26DRAFT_594865 [Trematosphaeria pertusa]|uniref:Extracellular membrane protein CFEM domain-containing protein n=1 Tax=Trematosphaeria pertusa TaxID=390896 RepID=A0A6A6IFD8_9PLEO|nr:uncharacterized protein BU26DRAFT_594865 [Trematosphaeria pertusa]KAF2249151.1 hypothetical protein BU26DRAFT_594865 [Trematosphaeria pertusa]